MFKIGSGGKDPEAQPSWIARDKAIQVPQTKFKVLETAETLEYGITVCWTLGDIVRGRRLFGVNSPVDGGKIALGTS